jgi:NarL family two-component system response regulator LiaR
LVRQGTRHILEEQPDLKVIAEAENGEQALEVVNRLHPDVAILDIRMPGLSVVEVVGQLRDSSPSTRILILSSFDDDDYILAFMEAGVSGYLLKTCQANDLVAAVRDVAQGKNVLHPDIAMKVARLWARRRVQSGQDTAGKLSPRELEVLKLAANGLHAKQIADELGISVRTINGHFDSIFKKLGVSSRVQAVIYALSQHLATLDKQR